MGTTQKLKLTEMQAFALEFLADQKEPVNPNYFGSQWHLHKHGRYPPAASRDSWGTTTSAYKTLRKLAELGLVEKFVEKTSSGYTSETFSLKNKQND